MNKLKLQFIYTLTLYIKYFPVQHGAREQRSFVADKPTLHKSSTMSLWGWLTKFYYETIGRVLLKF